mmetsp:Transcript_6266/g.10233  ORF Transcript_6266/g.10233 Transcript_6266/m.10233 type:complete len:189 (-) Transcript_6266:1710-2276(-)
MDADGKFPISKIKAQLLRDDDVGRVSTKAVELIAACSALFVNDLARSAMSTAEASQTRKRKSSSKTNTAAKDVTLVTLAQIKKSVKAQKEYNFLEGVLDGVTEKNAFHYDTAAAKKRKRLEDNDNTKQKNKSRKKTNAASKLPVEAGDSADNDVVENRALREAIETSVTSQNTHGQNREIIEDDDDYD